MIKTTFSTFKILIISLSFLLISLLVSKPAYSRGGGGGGGCFAEGTLILTPDGNTKIEQLHSGDRVINYNFDIAHQDRGYKFMVNIL